MAIAATTVWSADASATGSMVNGGGFNPGNANFISDWAATSATGNAPVITSATYSFVAGDVGALFYVKSGTNWTAGMYPIASVAGGAATLNAAIGAASQLDSASGLWKPSTVAGCATTGSPTAGTCGVNYAHLTAAPLSATDFASVGASTNLTSAGAGFTNAMVGNIFRLATTGTGAFGIIGWYEIVSYTNATTVVTDRTTNTGTALVAGTGKVGGALSFSGALEDSFLEGATSGTYGFQAGNFLFFKAGTYTISGSVFVASTLCTSTTIGRMVGFTSVWGDTPTGTGRPTVAAGSNGFAMGQYTDWSNIIFTGSGTAMGGANAGQGFHNCFFYNSSSSVDRNASGSADGYCLYENCEFVSLNGTGHITNGNGAGTRFMWCYFHDSVTGASNSIAQGIEAFFCLFENCKTVGFTSTSPNGVTPNVGYCTFYGSETTKIGAGINLNNAGLATCRIFGNIFYGLVTGITGPSTARQTNWIDWNDFYNNTTDVSNINKGPHDLALNPTFAGASQITGSTATTSGSVLTQTGGDFSTVTDNVDVLRVVSGTGVTVAQYLITGHTSTTLTVNNPLGTSSAGNVVYVIGVGHNFAIGTALKGLGGPTTFNGSETSQYLDPGAAQRQESIFRTNFQQPILIGDQSRRYA